MTDPELRQLAQAYFHQDFDLEAEGPVGTVRLFREESEAAETSRAVTELDRILLSNRSERQLRDLWLRDLCASYDPAVDGITYRQWFEQMRDVLCE